MSKQSVYGVSITLGHNKHLIQVSYYYLQNILPVQNLCHQPQSLIWAQKTLVLSPKQRPFLMVNKDGVTTLRTLLKIAGGKKMSFFSPKPKKVWQLLQMTCRERVHVSCVRIQHFRTYKKSNCLKKQHEREFINLYNRHLRQTRSVTEVPGEGLSSPQLCQRSSRAHVVAICCDVVQRGRWTNNPCAFPRDPGP